MCVLNESVTRLMTLQNPIETDKVSNIYSINFNENFEILNL